MKIHKCNECGKILDMKIDNVYSISEISKHMPNTRVSRLVLTKGPESEREELLNESWVNYIDLDFCEECFKKLSINKYLSSEEV